MHELCFQPIFGGVETLSTLALSLGFTCEGLSLPTTDLTFWCMLDRVPVSGAACTNKRHLGFARLSIVSGRYQISSCKACVSTCKLHAAHIHHFASGHRRASLPLGLCFPDTFDSHARCCWFPSILYLILVARHMSSRQCVPEVSEIMTAGASTTMSGWLCSKQSMRPMPRATSARMLVAAARTLMLLFTGVPVHTSAVSLCWPHLHAPHNVAALL